jgi:hypothetical protein
MVSSDEDDMSAIADPWQMTVPKPGGGGGGDFYVVPADNYPAVIVGLFDVGHQPSVTNEGTPCERHQVVLVFELVHQAPDGKPVFMAQRYTWSLHEKATFFSIVCNVIGRKLADGEKVDPRSVLGAACMVQIVNRPSKDGSKTYANVGSVTGFPKAFPAPKPSRQPLAWSVLQGTPPPETTWVPYVYGQSIADMVQLSSEHKAGKVPTSGGGTVTSGGDDVDPNCPF